MKSKHVYSSLYIISYYTGYIVSGTSLLMVIPIATALMLKEWNPLLDFIISFGLSITLGLLMILFGLRTQTEHYALKWTHGFVISALSWVVLMYLCSLPYLMSGHTLSLLDACFDVMSGFTTTGLALTQDLDHLSVSLNMWRHILTFVGGQGMVVLALTFLIKNTGGAYKVYVGEAKDIELLPNVKGTAREIWKISMINLFVGTLALWFVGMRIGLRPLSSFFHALFIFESSWSTGGFAPTSQNMMYYHSFAYENITLIFFILGSLNFGLHYAIWQGNRRELYKNIETQSFLVTTFLSCVGAVYILDRFGIYTEAVSVFRRVTYNILSAHTTTGFGSVYARQFAHEWGDPGIMILIIAMLIGGSACSTAGGIKGLRVGILVKGIIADVRRSLSSKRNMKQYKMHYMKTYILDDAMIKSASTITLLYVILFVFNTLLGVLYGYPLAGSAFESASVTGNVGLSIGIASASMPDLMKISYILTMYMGRLEFLSVFALIGFILGGVKNICMNIVAK